MWGVKKVKKKIVVMAGILVSGFLLACTPKSGGDAVALKPEPEKPLTRIEKMELHVVEGETSLLVRANAHLAYTAIKENDPPGLRLYFPDTVLDSNALPQETYGGDVLSFFAENISEEEVRLALILKAEFPYEVKNEGDTALRIVIDSGKGSHQDTVSHMDRQSGITEVPLTVDADGVQPVPQAQGGILQLQDIRARAEEGGVRIKILASAPLQDVHAFTISDPPRIVLDIAGLLSPFKGEQRLEVGTPQVRTVRHYAYPDKVRVVLDTTKEGMAAYEALTAEDGYAVFVAGVSALKAESVLPSKPLGVAEVKDMGFTPLPEGRSQFFIQTTQPVAHEIVQEDTKRLRLVLSNTELPARHQRPLITKGFESALDQVVPAVGTKGDAVFLVELREAVPYVLNHQGNRLELRFEASGIGPRDIEGAFVGGISEDPSESASVSQVMLPDQILTSPDQTAEDSVEEGIVPEVQDAPMTASGGRGKVFSGTPISIDFYETDIKNVFRILQHISGRNFAIDKDVSGKVTMSLEHPVPWDQIMDLVMRMNGLGMMEEGNIVRIATLDTLRREESVRQAVLNARLENERREVDLAPLMTEYILINYSNVTGEIMPHIQNVLTDRGKASADTRNNQLILTDTAEAIAKARAIIARIDKITPQVVIEARIVEASDDFGRDMGVNWQGNTGGLNQSPYATVQKDSLSGKYGYNVSLNTPTGAGNIGLHFARIAGSQLALNAQLNLSEQRGETKIVSSPRIVTLDNKTATINQGFEYPYTTRNKDGDVVTAFKNVDLKLEVTPHVTADNRVSLKVSIDKNDIHTMTTDGPALRTKKVETELLVNDGDTIVIGGVVTSDLATSNNRIPFLSNIPLLGWLFQSSTKKETKSELLIFLTPRIVQLENSKI